MEADRKTDRRASGGCDGVIRLLLRKQSVVGGFLQFSSSNNDDGTTSQDSLLPVRYMCKLQSFSAAEWCFEHTKVTGTTIRVQGSPVRYSGLRTSIMDF
jgi:hypothetical protein